MKSSWFVQYLVRSTVIVALLGLISCSTSTCDAKEGMGTTMDTANEILSYLDEVTDIGIVGNYPPAFDAYLFQPVSFRLSVFRGESDWVLAIEVIGYFEAGFSIDRVLHVYGPSLRNLGITDYETTDSGSDTLFSFLYEETKNYQPGYLKYGDDDFLHWLGDYQQFTIRWKGKAQTYRLDREDYEAIGIHLKSDKPGPGSLQPAELGRMLAHLLGDELFLTGEQLKTAIAIAKEEPADSVDLKLFYQTKLWEHPDFANRQVPSDTTFFPLLAEAIATGDVRVMDKFDLSKANSTWQYWAAIVESVWGDESGEVIYYDELPEETKRQMEQDQELGVFRKDMIDPPSKN